MTELKQRSGERLVPVDEQKLLRASSIQDDTLAATDAGTYDELDYRLMATFPASDAVAQY